MASSARSFTVMNADDVKFRLRLLANWDYQCVVCGYGFRDISSVTFEHIVPASLGGRNTHKKRRANNPNFAPSHSNCNRLRGNLSLLKAAKLVRRKRIVLGERDFLNWVNAPVPGRYVPLELLRVPTQRPIGCLELPEHLPGVP